MVKLGPGLRPQRPTPHGPPTSSGGREKWFVDGRRKRETKRFLSAFSQRVPTHVPSPPSRWAGRYGPFNVRAAGQVSRKRYSLPPHNPTREGGPGGGTSSPGGSFPHFFPRNGAPAGKPKFPAVPTAPGTPQWLPPPKPGAGPCLPPTTNGLPHILRQAVREIGKVKHWAALPGYRSVLLWPDPR